MALGGGLRGRGGGEFGFDTGLTLLVLNPGAIERLFLPAGEVYSWGRTLGREVATAAEAKLVPGHGYRTGELRRSIGSSVTPHGRSVAVNVRATAKHAIFYHEGTRPHHIEPHWPKQWLRFYWARVGHTVYLRAVNHPGYNGRPFLRDAMNEVLMLRGIVRL